jgi:hypothetical protein
VDNFQDLFNNVVQDETEEDYLNSQDEMVPSVDIAKELKHDHYYFIDRQTNHLDNTVVCFNDETTSGRNLERNLDNAELVDVGIVHGEVDDDEPCGSVNPKPLSGE